MEEGIRDAVISLSVEVAGLLPAFLIVRAEAADYKPSGDGGSTTFSWSSWRRLVEMISKHPPTQRAHVDRKALGLARDVFPRGLHST